VTKLCHIKRDYLVHMICSKRPPSDGQTDNLPLRSNTMLRVASRGKNGQPHFKNVTFLSEFDSLLKHKMQ